MCDGTNFDHHMRKNDLKWYSEAYARSKGTMRKWSNIFYFIINFNIILLLKYFFIVWLYCIMNQCIIR